MASSIPERHWTDLRRKTDAPFSLPDRPQAWADGWNAAVEASGKSTPPLAWVADEVLSAEYERRRALRAETAGGKIESLGQAMTAVFESVVNPGLVLPSPWTWYATSDGFVFRYRDVPVLTFVCIGSSPYVEAITYDQITADTVTGSEDVQWAVPGNDGIDLEGVVGAIDRVLNDVRLQKAQDAVGAGLDAGPVWAIARLGTAGARLWWHLHDGWTDDASKAHRFEFHELADVVLPPDGAWVQL